MNRGTEEISRLICNRIAAPTYKNNAIFSQSLNSLLHGILLIILGHLPPPHDSGFDDEEDSGNVLEDHSDERQAEWPVSAIKIIIKVILFHSIGITYCRIKYEICWFSEINIKKRNNAVDLGLVQWLFFQFMNYYHFVQHLYFF